MISERKHSRLQQAPMEIKTLHFHPYAINQRLTLQTDTAACSTASLVSTDWHMKAGKFALSLEIIQRVSQIWTDTVERPQTALHSEAYFSFVNPFRACFINQVATHVTWAHVYLFMPLKDMNVLLCEKQ